MLIIYLILTIFGLYTIYLTILPLTLKARIIKSNTTTIIMIIIFTPILIVLILLLSTGVITNNIPVIIALMGTLILGTYLKWKTSGKYQIFNLSYDKVMEIIISIIGTSGIPFKIDHNTLNFTGSGMIRVVHNRYANASVLFLKDMDRDFNEVIFYQELKMKLRDEKADKFNYSYLIFFLMALGLTIYGVFKVYLILKQ